MLYNVTIKAEAHADVLAAYNYYEDRQPGLGEAFLEAFESRCHDLSKYPDHYGYIAEDPQKVLRDVELKQFPYVLVFEIVNSAVIVYAVHCTYINPDSKLRK